MYIHVLQYHAEHKVICGREWKISHIIMLSKCSMRWSYIVGLYTCISKWLKGNTDYVWLLWVVLNYFVIFTCVFSSSLDNETIMQWERECGLLVEEEFPGASPDLPLTIQPWSSYWTPLCLGSLICKMGLYQYIHLVEFLWGYML